MAVYQAPMMLDIASKLAPTEIDVAPVGAGLPAMRMYQAPTMPDIASKVNWSSNLGH